jgi:hypothetical protein
MVQGNAYRLPGRICQLGVLSALEASQRLGRISFRLLTGSILGTELFFTGFASYPCG